MEVYMQGTIRKVIRDRGFGFIRDADGKEIFFHRSSLQRLSFDALMERDAVEFDPERTEKRPRAVSVRPRLQ
jgi:cold shock CspA family protein